MTDLEKKLLQEQQNRASADFGTGSLLMRPEDSSIQKASEDFMGFLNNPTAEMMSPEAPVVPMSNVTPIEDYDAMVEQDALDKSLKAASAMSASIPATKAPSMPQIPSSPKIPSTPQEDILAQLKAARAANEAAMGSARAADKSTELGNLIMKSGAMAGQGIVNRAGNTNIKLDPAQVAAKEAELAGISGKGRLDALMQDYGIKKGIEDTDYARKTAEQARKDKLSERAEDRAYKNKMLDIASQKATKTAEMKPSEGQKALDKSFAKDYNEWETSGKTLVDSNFKVLNEAIAKLKKAKDDTFGTSGRVTGRLPDLLRSEESIALRDDVQKTAMASLRATLGAQFTENEGERIMAKAYNEKLSPAENIKKIESAIKEIKDRAENMEKRSEYFVENAGTLKGLKSEGLNLETKAMSPQDEQAKKWATSNPNDPRAAAILKRLGL